GLAESLVVTATQGGSNISGAASLTMTLVVSTLQEISTNLPVTISLLASLIQNIEANLSSIPENLSASISVGGHALQAVFSLVMALAPSITQSIEANLSNLSESLSVSISTGGHALEAAFALTISFGLTMLAFIAHSYVAAYLLILYFKDIIIYAIKYIRRKKYEDEDFKGKRK